jgi:hypothetical protein
MKYFFCIVFLISYSNRSWSQMRFMADQEIETSAGFYLSSSNRTPYLNKTNRYGVVPLEAQTFFLNGSLRKTYDSLAQNRLKWGYTYGVEIQANLGNVNQILLPEIFVAGKYKALEVFIGRRKEIFGLADTSGTWKSFIWSGNALPIPKIQIFTPKYFSILGKGMISAKLGFSHGVFGDQLYTKNYYLHQKWLYLKIGRESGKVNLIGGIMHNAQWGGYSESLKFDSLNSSNGYLASDLFAYLNVFAPLKIWKRPAHRYSAAEMEYRFGNHLGTLDFGIHLKALNGTFRFYRQTPWEDGQAPEVFFSGDGNYTLSYLGDIWGKVNKVSFEFLNTKRQGFDPSPFAKLIGIKEKHPGEMQNYLTHVQYIEGWSYEGSAIGTSAIMNHGDLKEGAKVSGAKGLTRDNRVIAPALNIAGSHEGLDYQLRLAFIHSKGTVMNPRPEGFNQFSSSIAVGLPLPKYGISVNTSLGFDQGQMYGNQIGANFSINKRW